MIHSWDNSFERHDILLNRPQVSALLKSCRDRLRIVTVTQRAERLSTGEKVDRAE